MASATLRTKQESPVSAHRSPETRLCQVRLGQLSFPVLVEVHHPPPIQNNFPPHSRLPAPTESPESPGSPPLNCPSLWLTAPGAACRSSIGFQEEKHPRGKCQSQLTMQGENEDLTQSRGSLPRPCSSLSRHRMLWTLGCFFFSSFLFFSFFLYILEKGKGRRK